MTATSKHAIGGPQAGRQFGHQTHNDFAVLLMDNHVEITEARRQLERAVQIDPNLANAEANLSLLCAKTRDYEAAIRHGKRALALDAKQLDCYTLRVFALRGKGGSARRSEARTAAVASRPALRSPPKIAITGKCRPGTQRR